MNLLFPQAFTKQTIFPGPFRVFPGSLSVARTFGDIRAKKPKYGGMPNIVIAEPEIKTIPINSDLDWILLGSDGIFDKMSNEKIFQVVWNTAQQESLLRERPIGEIVSLCVDAVLQEAMKSLSLDNITAVLIAFQGFQNAIFKEMRTTQTQSRINSSGHGRRKVKFGDGSKSRNLSMKKERESPEKFKISTEIQTRGILSAREKTEEKNSSSFLKKSP